MGSIYMEWCLLCSDLSGVIASTGADLLGCQYGGDGTTQAALTKQDIKTNDVLIAEKNIERNKLIHYYQIKPW